MAISCVIDVGLYIAEYLFIRCKYLLSPYLISYAINSWEYAYTREYAYLLIYKHFDIWNSMKLSTH